MNKRTRKISWPRLFGYAGLVLILPARFAWAVDGIVTDGSMGAVQSLSDANVIIPQALGNTVGTNLFHSFSEFNIAKGQTVDFTGSNALRNVISRVTGVDTTEINGTLKSSIANAAFYFINPNGITFGTGAQVDVPSALHISTADKIDFPDNHSFQADSRQQSTLSSEMPIAYGFLGTSTHNNGLIDVNSAQLTVNAGQTQDFVAGQINVENNAHLTAPAGEIRLVATQGESSVSVKSAEDNTLPLPTITPSPANAGLIAISMPVLNDPFHGVLDTSGNGAGRIALWGGKVSFTNSTAYNDNSGATDATLAKGVDIRAASLNVNNSWISADALDAGKASNISISASDTLTTDHSANIKSFAYLTGNAGAVNINAGQFDILNGSQITSSTYGQGQAGTLTVNTDHLKIDGLGNTLSTGIVSRANLGSRGQASDINLQTEQLEIFNGGSVYSTTFTESNAGNIKVTANSLTMDSQGYPAGFTRIASGTESESNGNAGNLNLHINQIDLLNNSAISSFTNGKGNAGNINLQTEHLSITDGAQITNDTFAQGGAGNIAISANTLKINSQHNLAIPTGIISNAQAPNSGHAGNIDIRSQSLNLIKDGNITSVTYGLGDAGNVSIQSAKLNLFGGRNVAGGLQKIGSGNIASFTAGQGNAGNVTIQADKLNIFNGARITSSTFSPGNAGDIDITADALTINSQGNTTNSTGIASQANQSTGNAGNLNIQANTFTILNGGNVSTSTFSKGNAGNINVTANQLTIDGLNSPLFFTTGLSSEVKPTSHGQTGDIKVQASDSVQLLNGGVISIENAGKAQTAPQQHSIMVTTPNLNMTTESDVALRRSAISTNATGVTAADNIALNISQRLTMDFSLINTAANTGNGGNIQLNNHCDLVQLHNSRIETSVNQGSKQGGDLNLTANLLVMTNSLIQANADAGKGGSITLNSNSLIPSNSTLLQGGLPIKWGTTSGFNLIQAASKARLDGVLNVTAPQLNLSGIIANLGNPPIDQGVISPDYCGLDIDSSLTRTGDGGLKPKSSDQLLF